MRVARASEDFAGPVAAAERLWYDHDRWASFVDGFGHVTRLDEGWPAAGARLVWDSRPGGRGRVSERVLAHEPGAGQTVEVEDERLRGEQTIAFEELEDGVAVSVELRYELKRTDLPMRIADAVFIKRALTDSLRRTLTRFGRELADDLSFR